ncbi:phage tail termination protein [Amycolatopsis sp. NPDC004368]
MAGFIDVEKAILDVLSDLGTDSGTAVPTDIPNPFICVQRVPGSAANAQGWQDVALIEVSTWAVTRPESMTLNGHIRQRLVGAVGVETTYGFIDSIEEAGAPAQMPYGDEDTRWVPSTWLVVSRIQ